MRILYIGGGFVGACSAAVSADSGHDALVFDIDKEKVKKLSSLDKDTIESCLFEEGLGELIIRNEKRLKFTHNLAEAGRFVDETRAVFMCLPTPEKGGSGETDLTIYEAACRMLAGVLAKRNNGRQDNYVLVINKSTVPIEMIGRTRQILEAGGVKNFGVGANPEFLVEGKAIEGSIRPQRIVVGAWEERDFGVFRDIYKRFCDAPNVTYIEVNPVEAAAAKLLANYILFNRLANCFDVVGRTCEKFEDLHYENIRKALITDKRIGDWGFYDSLFAGGSCFIKDARSLAHQLKEKGAVADLVADTLAANQRQLDDFLARPERELNYSWTGKRVGLLGLAFKRETNDTRNSAALSVTEFLFGKNVASIKAHDPVAGENYLGFFAKHPDKGKLRLEEEAEAVMAESDALIIATDWPQFRELADVIREKFPRGSLIMDGRRMLAGQYEELSRAGYDIIAVGSPTIRAGNA